MIAREKFHSLYKVINVLLEEVRETLRTNLKEFVILAKNNGLRTITLSLAMVTHSTIAEAFDVNTFHKGMNEVFVMVNNGDELITSFNLKLFKVGSKGEVNDIHHNLTIELRKSMLGEDILHSHILFGSSIGDKRHTLLSKTLVHAVNLLGSSSEGSEGEVHSLSPFVVSLRLF
jgi:hypothetical protein